MSVRGYCRTLRPPSPDIFGSSMGRSDFEPAMRMTKLTTNARTGRFMKRSVNDFISIFSGERTHPACFVRHLAERVLYPHGPRGRMPQGARWKRALP